MTTAGYTLSISKDELALLPTISFDGEITIVDSAACAHAAIRALQKEDYVGFDTETKPSFRKGNCHKVALLQLSTDSRCFLFRLNKIGICADLKKFLENPSITKIGLSLHDDFNSLNRTETIEPQGFIELQKLVKEYNISDTSLQKIYGIIFGERISKHQRLTNWEADELSAAQQSYAALDAWACLHLYRHLLAGNFNPQTSPYARTSEKLPQEQELNPITQ